MNENPTIQEIKSRHVKIISEMRKLFPQFSHRDSDFSDVMKFTDEVLGEQGKGENHTLTLVNLRLQELQHMLNVLTTPTQWSQEAPGGA